MNQAPIVSLAVHGIPTTQGSKKGFVVKGRAVLVDVKKESLNSWREAIRSDIARELGPGWEPETGPVRVVLRFALPKPASAPKRKRTWPVSSRSGDLDKLQRAVFDAITDSGLWRDDSQVVDVQASKDWTGVGGLNVPGVRIVVYRVEDDAA